MSKNRKNTLKAAATVTLALSLTLPAASALAASPAPVSQSGTALAPLRETATGLGATVHWDQNKQTITVKKGAHVLVLQPNKKEALLDGQTVTLNNSVRIVSGQTLIEPAFMNKIFPTAETPADPADDFMDLLKAGNGTEAAAYVGPEAAVLLSADVLGKLWSNYESIFGKVSGQAVKTEATNSVHRNVTYTFQAANTPFLVTLRMNAQGQIDDFFANTVTPSLYQKPAYDNSDAYTEQEITVGEGAMALPGTLTLPKGDGSFPAVVLVHGSGPHDRDSSIGSAKVFRDLAAGLASQGIAVLRYDKITYEHSMKVSADPKFTLKRETVDDALAAVKLLKNNAKIDASKIFVAGHSQGAFAVPMMIDADKNDDIAGAILLSGPSGKFADILALQQKELVSRVKQSGLDTTLFEQQAAQYTAVADMVNDPKYTVDNMPANFPMPPAYWWYEQKNYVPSEVAKKQTGPLLILQGENDWQVPLSQLDGWKQALKDRTDVEYKSYPKVNHLLAEYDGISIGSEYYQPSNVSKSIVDDIAAWVKKTK
ncbi:alpha/beta fold hydrolase [Paenibacillus vini]|uniref:alpha/beta hydrolase family protein n=1 Tax=Paenibacillus vini TaxID=1476024 RepID=UPI0025B636AF|nr:alpha/beta fold hydrolase [Paenibacillus vini]MDN4070778.1 alpha/beta fold hydrolase [Paenibacillus vini]